MSEHHDTRCGFCNTPADGTFLCSPCTQALRDALTTIGDHWSDLTDAIGKRINRQTSETHTDTPVPGIPFNPRAADLEHQIIGAVGRLSVSVKDRTGQTPVGTTMRHRCKWLIPRVYTQEVRCIPTIAAHRGDLDYLARDLMRTIDKPNRRISVPAPCPDCGGPLEAELRRPRVITCKDCRTEHDATRFLAAG